MTAVISACIKKESIKIGEFLYSHFTIADGRNKQHFQQIILYYFKEDYKHNWNAKKICAVYGEGAVTDQMGQKWFAKFRAGDFSLDNAP